MPQDALWKGLQWFPICGLVFQEELAGLVVRFGAEEHFANPDRIAVVVGFRIDFEVFHVEDHVHGLLRLVLVPHVVLAHPHRIASVQENVLVVVEGLVQKRRSMLRVFPTYLVLPARTDQCAQQYQAKPTCAMEGPRSSVLPLIRSGVGRGHNSESGGEEQRDRVQFRKAVLHENRIWFSPTPTRRTRRSACGISSGQSVLPTEVWPKEHQQRYDEREGTCHLLYCAMAWPGGASLAVDRSAKKLLPVFQRSNRRNWSKGASKLKTGTERC
ncbi:MAG: hypothetical protein IPO87_19080 [Flavobacteriales bacterium]|nr:hypothetical protein [Flavobacteriales bacterium]